MSSADSNHDERPTIRIGKHEITYEGDDFMVIRARGPISVDDARTMAFAERELWKKADEIYLMVVVDSTTSVDSGMLSEVRSIYSGRPTHTSALVGASFTLQTVGGLINRALRLIGRPSSLRFFKDEATARAWIADERQKRAARQR